MRMQNKIHLLNIHINNMLLKTQYFPKNNKRIYVKYLFIKNQTLNIFKKMAKNGNKYENYF